MKEFFNKVLVKGKIPDKWKKGVVVPIFEGKRDIQDCRNHRDIKIMCFSMKIWEKIIDNSNIKKLDVSN